MVSLSMITNTHTNKQTIHQIVVIVKIFNLHFISTFFMYLLPILWAIFRLFFYLFVFFLYVFFISVAVVLVAVTLLLSRFPSDLLHRGMLWFFNHMHTHTKYVECISYYYDYQVNNRCGTMVIHTVDKWISRMKCVLSEIIAAEKEKKNETNMSRGETNQTKGITWGVW